MHKFCSLRVSFVVVICSLLTMAIPASAEPAPSSSESEAAGTEIPGDYSVGLPPSLPEMDSASETERAPSAAVPGAARAGGAQFEFHGYMRAPLRVGVGPKNDGGGGGTGGGELHAPPRVPDLSFTDWRYLDLAPGPWTELIFSYGNERVTMTSSIAAYNHTSAGFRELQAQLGINQAFLTLRFPDVFGKHGGLNLNVGSFSNRYGNAGKYNAGMYETYLFGKTRAVGETLTAGLHLTPDLELALEHGVGAKLDVIDPSALTPRPSYLPYPGPVPQGSTFLHHAHAQMSIQKLVTVGGHYLTSWTPNDRALPGMPTQSGRMTVTGGDVRLDGGVYGDGYLGYSHISARNIQPLADAIEVLHSFGGWQFKNNYFGKFNPRTGTAPPDVSGTVNSILGQYSLSVGKLARYPARFWGKGPDLVATVFGMFNSVNSASNSHDKLKWGMDAIYTPFAEFGVGARYDLVQPNLKSNNESFSVISPRIEIRTEFASHERVVIQYSRYFLGSEAYAAFPYNELPKADSQVLMIAGSMWW